MSSNAHPDQIEWEYRVRDAHGYPEGSIGYQRPDGSGRVSYQIEKILNSGADEGFELDRIDHLRTDRAIVVMRRPKRDE